MVRSAGEASLETRNAEAHRGGVCMCGSGTPRTGSDSATQQEAAEGGVLRRWKLYFQGCCRSGEGFLGANCSWVWCPVLPAVSRSLEPPPQERKGRAGLEG